MKSISDELKKKKRPKKKSAQLESTISRDLLTTEKKTHVATFDDGKVRPEYNFAKFADRLFLAPQSKKLYDTRRITWQMSLFKEDNGDPKKYPAEILIEPLNKTKSASITDWKTFLGIIGLWENRGFSPDGVVLFSARELATEMNQKWHGGFGNKIRKSLKSLRGTLYTWTFAFIHEGKPLKRIKDLNILSHTDYVENLIREDNEKFEPLHRVQINEILVNEMLSGNTIPVVKSVAYSIKSGTHLILYTQLCTFLSTNTIYERRAKNLLGDLEIVGERYKQKYARKAKLNEFKKALDGKETPWGYMTMDIVETSDGKDWKLTARAVRIKAKGSLPWKPVNTPELTEDLTTLIFQAVGQEESMANWKKIAACYPEILVRRAVSEFKADLDPKEVQNSGAIFNTIMKRIATESGKKWITKVAD